MLRSEYLIHLRYTRTHWRQVCAQSMDIDTYTFTLIELNANKRTKLTNKVQSIGNVSKLHGVEYLDARNTGQNSFNRNLPFG